MMEPDFSRLLARVVNTRYAYEQGLDKKLSFVDEVTKIDNASQLSTLPAWVNEYFLNAMSELSGSALGGPIRMASAPEPAEQPGHERLLGGQGNDRLPDERTNLRPRGGENA